MAVISIVRGCDEYKRLQSKGECLCLGRATHYDCIHGGRTLCLRLRDYLSLMYNSGHTSFVPPSTIILLLTYPKMKSYRWNYDILDIVQVWTEEEFRRIQHAL
ncbi:hypothetical protein Tco_0806510 [Tanacetum coccineum]